MKLVLRDHHSTTKPIAAMQSLRALASCRNYEKKKKDWHNFSSLLLSALQARCHWVFMQSFVLSPHPEQYFSTNIIKITAQIVFMFVANRVYLWFSSGISNTARLFFCGIESSFVNPPRKPFWNPSLTCLMEWLQLNFIWDACETNVTPGYKLAFLFLFKTVCDTWLHVISTHSWLNHTNLPVQICCESIHNKWLQASVRLEPASFTIVKTLPTHNKRAGN